MNTYYIAFEAWGKDSNSHLQSWVIRKTENDMDSPYGLDKEIKAIEKERDVTIFIYFWKKLEGREIEEGEQDGDV